MFRLKRIYYIWYMKTYSVKEASELIGITERSVQLRCKKEDIRKKNNRYLITEEHIKDWITNTNEAKQNEPSLITEEFTEEQYNKLQEVIEKYPLQLKDIQHLQEMIESYKLQLEYLKKSLDKKDDIMQRLLTSLDNHTQNLLQKNYIEAKDKNYDD